MLLAGVGIPVMAALNSALGARIGAAGAAASLFAVALCCSLTALLASRSTSWSAMAGIPVHLFAGGIFVAFYVLSITTLAPKMGVATAVLFVILGQLGTAAAIDHFGLLGAAKAAITPTRFVGLVLVTMGVLLARRPT
ncbi:MAG: hypothetical protein COB36_12690 [Alphaproteobacteria bacterium]|nr:MAG: hypothetical protein COB36_12690 [Alphaproteobacteria bacterium]